MISLNYDMLMGYIHGLNIVSITLRLFLAVVFGAILGIDRSRKNQPAGFRTHMLVCMGAALVMITNQYITVNFAPSDPARLGAQVISGIGFLGAGTIIVTRSNQVRGLTTAAGLWVSACIGLTIGVGFFSGAIIAEVFIIIIVCVMHNIDSSLHVRSRIREVYVEFAAPEHLSAMLTYIRGSAVQLNHVEHLHSRQPMNSMAIIMTLKLPAPQDHIDVMHNLRKLEGVICVEEV